MIDLEDRLSQTIDYQEISSFDRTWIDKQLAELREKLHPTYEHSVRVALLGFDVALYLQEDPKHLWRFGLLHDIGKLDIDPEIVDKQGAFTDEDRAKMREHPIKGYLRIYQNDAFTAEMIVRSHRFQPNSYPEELPKTTIPFSKLTMDLIDVYARIGSIIDHYDAFTTRESSLVVPRRMLTSEEARTFLISRFPAQQDFILPLYEQGIFI